ncbi:MAG: bifunctional DNA primase/polymerase [Streptomycetaceae bacterium]|nr:bifunctional DNA primase/polymerase [Streptomycetaceae bacterium]
MDLTPGQVAAVKDGVDVLRLLAQTRGRADPSDGELTMTVRTPSGGLHLWFSAPARTAWRGSVGGDHQGPVLGWQLDVRARGGYIVAPAGSAPSVVPGSSIAAPSPASRDSRWRRLTTARSPSPARSR